MKSLIKEHKGRSGGNQLDDLLHACDEVEEDKDQQEKLAKHSADYEIAMMSKMHRANDDGEEKKRKAMKSVYSVQHTHCTWELREKRARI